VKLLISAGICLTVSAGCFIKGSAEFPHGRRSANGQSKEEIAFRRTVRCWQFAGLLAAAYTVAALITIFLREPV